MKAVQSVWFNTTSKEANYSCGWLSKEFNFMSWALSSFQISRFFSKCSLVTDEIGIEFAHILGLPYDSVDNKLENIKLQNYLWVMNKMYTYSIQNEPFIHVDTDVYFFCKPSPQFLNAPLFAQNFEYDHENYKHAFNDVSKFFKHIPSYAKKDKVGRITAVNAGVIGGNNWLFFKKFYHEVVYFLRENELEIDYCNYEHLNVFVEQFLLKQYADFYNTQINYISPIEFGPPCDYNMSRFIDLPDKNNYIHVTNYKRNRTICEQLGQRLWIEAPHLYEKVTALCRHLEATHHLISSEKQFQSLSFYRTRKIMSLLNILDICNDATQEQINDIIINIPESRSKDIIYDIFNFEISRQEFIRILPDASTILRQWKDRSCRVNDFFSNLDDKYSLYRIGKSSSCAILESEWNWAENNEFAGQGFDRTFVSNLEKEPMYYEVLVYYYPQQHIVVEQLLDITNILLFQFLTEPTQISVIVEKISLSFLHDQTQMNQFSLTEIILSRIRFFLYNGVLEIIM